MQVDAVIGEGEQKVAIGSSYKKLDDLLTKTFGHSFLP